jgi:hypothetical protein
VERWAEIQEEIRALNAKIAELVKRKHSPYPGTTAEVGRALLGPGGKGQWERRPSSKT